MTPEELKQCREECFQRKSRFDFQCADRWLEKLLDHAEKTGEQLAQSARVNQRLREYLALFTQAFDHE